MLKQEVGKSGGSLDMEAQKDKVGTLGSPCSVSPATPPSRGSLPGGDPEASFPGLAVSLARKDHSAVFPPQYSHKRQAVRVGVELMRGALRISAVTFLFQADLGEGDGYTFQDG